MEELVVDDRLVKENEQLRGVKDFFSRLYYEDFTWRPKLSDLDFMSLDYQSCESLERKFSKEKILEGLMQYR